MFERNCNCGSTGVKVKGGIILPESEARGRVEGWLSVEGSITFVRLGRGEDGREGGSWVGAGVADILGMFGVEGGERM